MAPAVQIWIDGDEPGNVARLATRLSQLVREKEGLKGILIDVDESRQAMLEQLPHDNIAIACLPADEKLDVIEDFRLGPFRNTIVLYKNKTVEAVYENMNAEDFDIVAAAAKLL